jgi:sortase B
MGRRLRRALTAALGAVFLFSVCYIIVARLEYRASARRYEEAAARFTSHGAGADGSGGPGEGTGSGMSGSGPAGQGAPFAGSPPITVDFAGLQAVNGDVCGWLYCPGTPIDYPVLRGEDDDAYLHRAYDGSYSAGGSLFVEALNRPGFADANTIVYGHHMRDGSMFACLERWAEPGFYEAHPVMWLLTPEDDYRIDIFAGYTTSGYSDTYTIYTEGCPELAEYLGRCLEQSDFAAGTEPEAGGRYVTLSTCAYAFTDARYVLHGRLVPVDSAGGEAPSDGQGRG